jgi:hypothetical protein
MKGAGRSFGGSRHPASQQLYRVRLSSLTRTAHWRLYVSCLLLFVRSFNLPFFSLLCLFALKR